MSRARTLLLAFLTLALLAVQGGGASRPNRVPPAGGGPTGDVDSGTLTVTVSHAEDATSSGLSGVGLQPIQFDAWASSCGSVAIPTLCSAVANADPNHPHDLERGRLNFTILWDFGSVDTSRTYWHGMSNQYDEGFQVGHVFAPGDHTVIAYLLNKEGETLDTQSWTFSIATGDAKYPTTATHCLSADATYDGLNCPVGATEVGNQSDLDAYLSTARPDIRILLDDSETFNLSARINCTAHAGGWIDTNPAAPATIVQTVDSTEIVWCAGGSTTQADFWRLSNVQWKFADSLATSDTNAGSRIFIHMEHRHDYLEIIDTKVVGLSGQAGFYMESALNQNYDSDASELPQWTAIVGNDWNCTGDIGYRRNIHFWSSERLLYLDNCGYFTEFEGGVEHLFRSNGQQKFAIRHNELGGVRPEKNLITTRDFCDHNAPNNCTNLIETDCDAQSQSMSWCSDSWGGLIEIAFNSINYAAVGTSVSTVSPFDLAGQTAAGAGIGFTQGYFLRANYIFVDTSRDAVTFDLPNTQKIVSMEAGGAAGVYGFYDNVVVMGGEAQGYDGFRCGGSAYCVAEGNTVVDPADNGAGHFTGFLGGSTGSRLIGNVVQKNHSGYTLLLDDGSFTTKAANVETTGIPATTSDCGIDFVNAHTSLAALNLDDATPDNDCESGGQQWAHFLTLGGWRTAANPNAGAYPIVQGSNP